MDALETGQDEMSSLVTKLKSNIHRTMETVIGKTSPQKIVLLDAPDHGNVGDQAILLGEFAYLKEAHPSSSIRIASWRTYKLSSDDIVEDSDIVAIHGGGNFGDIWANHHNFRIQIMERFPDKRIIQFPQSIHFSDQSAVARTASAIRKCSRYTLMVRDQVSLEVANRIFDADVVLCPDMAFALGELSSSRSVKDVFCLLRTDKEVKEEKRRPVFSALTNARLTYAENDWLSGDDWTRRLHTILRYSAKMDLSARAGIKFGLPAFKRYANARMNYGIGMLSQGETVLTDRLHGMILATLIGRKRFIFDSYDGKIKNFYNTWMREEDDAKFFQSAEDFTKFMSRPELRQSH